MSLTALSFIYTEFSDYGLIRLFLSLTITNLFSLFFSKYVEKQNLSLLKVNKSRKLRNEILELTLNTNELPHILSKIALSIEKEVPNGYCSILLVDDSAKCLITGAAPSLPTFYNDAVNGVVIGEGVGSCGHAAFTKSRTIIDDITTHPNWAAWIELTLSLIHI